MHPFLASSEQNWLHSQLHKNRKSRSDPVSSFSRSLVNIVLRRQSHQHIYILVDMLLRSEILARCAACEIHTKSDDILAPLAAQGWRKVRDLGDTHPDVRFWCRFVKLQNPLLRYQRLLKHISGSIHRRYKSKPSRITYTAITFKCIHS